MSFYFGTPGEARGAPVAKIFKIPLYIESGFLFLLAFYFLSSSRGGAIDLSAYGMFCLVIFISILAHELGHALTARAMGCDGIRIALTFGGYATHSPTTHGKTILILLAGPLANLVLYGLARGATHLQGGFWDLGANQAMVYFVYYMMGINLFLLVANLMPIYPLDGGQTLMALLSFRMRAHEAFLWVVRISVGVGAIAGILAYQKFGQPYFGILCFFLVFINVQHLMRR